MHRRHSLPNRRRQYWNFLRTSMATYQVAIHRDPIADRVILPFEAASDHLAKYRVTKQYGRSPYIVLLSRLSKIDYTPEITWTRLAGRWEQIDVQA